MGKHQTKSQRRESQARHRQRGQPRPYPTSGDWFRVTLEGFDHLTGGKLLAGVGEGNGNRYWAVGYVENDEKPVRFTCYAAPHLMEAAFYAELRTLEDAYIASL